jgi:hypothetical protein
MAGASVSRRRSTTSAVLLATLLAGTRVLAQAPPTEAQVKAAFVYNFLKFVEWPATAFGTPQDSFVVAIIGDGETADATGQFLASKQIGARSLVTRHLAWEDSLAGVHALFVAERDPKKQRRIFAAAAAASVLSIGEGAEFAVRGGVIALFVENRKVRFDIDLDAAQAAGLQISSKLLALTRTVHSTATSSGARP